MSPSCRSSSSSTSDSTLGWLHPRVVSTIAARSMPGTAARTARAASFRPVSRGRDCRIASARAAEIVRMFGSAAGRQAIASAGSISGSSAKAGACVRPGSPSKCRSTKATNRRAIAGVYSCPQSSKPISKRSGAAPAMAYIAATSSPTSRANGSVKTSSRRPPRYICGVGASAPIRSAVPSPRANIPSGIGSGHVA
ncbi:MAG: hypothetical protein NTW19_18185 [Planctomycetota bacterium]|nr:hypothetical protein [Planctomycetota bacterium]